VDEHPRAAGERVGVQVKLVQPVLEPVLHADRLVRQLAGLPRGHEPDSQLTCQRATEDEAAGLGGDDQVDGERARVLGEQADRVIERRRIEQQGRDVPEHDSRLGEVGDVADVVAQVQPAGC
jgi:hypothetical protein